MVDSLFFVSRREKNEIPGHQFIDRNLLEYGQRALVRSYMRQIDSKDISIDKPHKTRTIYSPLAAPTSSVSDTKIFLHFIADLMIETAIP